MYYYRLGTKKSLKSYFPLMNRKKKLFCGFPRLFLMTSVSIYFSHGEQIQFQTRMNETGISQSCGPGSLSGSESVTPSELYQDPNADPISADHFQLPLQIRISIPVRIRKLILSVRITFNFPSGSGSLSLSGFFQCRSLLITSDQVRLDIRIFCSLFVNVVGSQSESRE